jgi:DNA-directed RNA polymerase specialized sigma24 family protein
MDKSVGASVPAVEGNDCLSEQEICAGIKALPTADWRRLKKAAAWLTLDRPDTAEDLLQETLLRSVAAERKCPRDVRLITFLLNAMKSIASAGWKKKHTDPLLRAVPNHGAPGDLALPDVVPSAEDTVLQADETKKMTDKLFALFENDEVAQIVVMGSLAGDPVSEIRIAADLDQIGYETVRKRIRRRIEKKFPNGWRP